MKIDEESRKVKVEGFGAELFKLNKVAGLRMSTKLYLTKGFSTREIERIASGIALNVMKAEPNQNILKGKYVQELSNSLLRNNNPPTARI